jgi:hypothetical protein
MAESQPQNQDFLPSFAIEHVAAKLEPFDLLQMGLRLGGTDQRSDVSNLIQQATRLLLKSANIRAISAIAASVTSPANSQRNIRDQHALAPIFSTGGLVFPYNPNISESVSVKYDAVELTHTNESFHVYRGTDNVRISISDATWTCDTFDNAVYAMSVLHFFRTYSQMDFGRGRTGRPPSPMWFSAYGNYAFHRVPVLMEKADWSFPPDVDYVGIPEFGTPEYQSRILKYERDSGTQYTWLPMVFKVSSISLVVQHAPTFWSNWNLDMYRSGEMLRQRKSFHTMDPIHSSRKNSGR